MKLFAIVLVLALVVCALTLDLRTRRDRVQSLLDAMEETESSREEEPLPFAREMSLL
jgi:signal transduction histidine kinase